MKDEALELALEVLRQVARFRPMTYDLKSDEERIDLLNRLEDLREDASKAITTIERINYLAQ
jgi:hypothetical protein